VFESTKRNVAMISGGAALTFCLATGAVAGVVPTAGSSDDSSHSATIGIDVVATPAAPEAQAPPSTEAPTTEAPTTAPPATTPPVTAPPTTAARRASRTAEAPTAATSAPAPAAAAPAAPAAPAIPPRTNPSSAQVRSAISSLGLPLTPSESQARQFGDSVCDAFDQGQTFAQVKASALQAASQIPFVTVSPSAIDGGVRTAVNLFCPGHASKLT
jgi:hypothetical protein